MADNIYQEHGYKDRADYLRSLAEEHEVDIEVVNMVAGIYGPEEDFDGLVSQIQDLAAEGGI